MSDSDISFEDVSRDELIERIQNLERKLGEVEVAVHHRHENKLADTVDLVFGDEGLLDDGAEEQLHESPLLDRVLALEKRFAELEAIDDLRETIVRNHRTVLRDNARLRRQLNHLAEETGIDLLEGLGNLDDKITFVRKNGIAALEDKPTSKHERVQVILQNLEEWGETRSDANGSFVYLSSTVAKQRLEDVRDESLQPTQIKRVFITIRDYAADSTRRVSIEKTDAGRNLLRVEVGRT